MAHVGDWAGSEVTGGPPADARSLEARAAEARSPAVVPPIAETPGIDPGALAADPPEGRGRLSSRDLARLIVRGGAWSLGISAIGAALSVGVHLLLARVVGAEEYGRYVYALAWMNVLVLVGKFELDTASVRFVGAYSGTEQWAFLRGFLRRSSQIAGGLSVGIALSSIAVVLLFFDRFERSTALTFLAASVLLPISAIAQVKASAIQGLRHVARAQVPSLIVRPVVFVLGVLAVLYLVGRSVTAPVAILLQVGATTVALVLSLRFLRTILPRPVRDAGATYDTRYWMKTAAGMLVISGGQIVLSTNADVLVVGSLLGPGDAGRYSAASQLALAVSFGVSAISFIALPMIADLHARGAMRQLQQLISHVARLGLLLSAPVLLALTVAAGPALSAFGPTFSDASGLLILLGLDQLIAAIFGIAGYLLVMTGHQATAARVIVGCAVLNLVLTFVLTPAFGAIGAGAATTITTLVRSYLLTTRMSAALGLSLAPWTRRSAATPR